MRRIVGFTAAFLTFATSLLAQSANIPLRLDFRNALSTSPSSAPVAGFESYYLDQPYRPYATTVRGQTLPPQLWGWADAVAPIGFTSSAGSVEAAYPDLGATLCPNLAAHRAMLADGHVVTDKVFRIAVPSIGRYRIHVILGRADTQTHSLLVSGTNANGAEVPVVDEVHPLAAVGTTLEGLWARTLTEKAKLQNASGGFRSLWFDTYSVAPPQPTIGPATVSVRFHTTSQQLPIVAMEAYLDETPPIVFDLSSRTISTSASLPLGTDQQSLTTGIAQLNSGNASSAYAHFLNLTENDITTKSAKAHALLWVAGWIFDGAPQDQQRTLFGTDGIEWAAVRRAAMILDSIAIEDRMGADSEAHGLAHAYLRALSHHVLRGYDEPVSIPNASDPLAIVVQNPFLVADCVEQSPSPIVSNLNASEALWRDLAAQRLADVLTHSSGPEPIRGVHPLFFKSAMYLGINWWQRNSLNSTLDPATGTTDPFSYAFIKQHFDLWREFAATPNPIFRMPSVAGGPDHNDALAVLTHMATYSGSAPAPIYDEDNEGGIVAGWPLNPDPKGPEVVHGPGENRSWLTLSPVTTALEPCASLALNPWAIPMASYSDVLGAAHRWWIERRFQSDQFGGGTGDDEELLLAQIHSTLPRQGWNTTTEDASLDFAVSALEQWLPEYFYEDPCDGAPGDVEHTAEYTTNPLWYGMTVSRGDPWFHAYALRIAERFDSAIQDEAWTGTLSTSVAGFVPSPPTHVYPKNSSTVVDATRFLAWHLDARGVYYGAGNLAHAGDVTLNGRVMVPVLLAAQYNRNAAASRVMREYAEWWWWVLSDDGTLTPGGATSANQSKPRGVPPASVTYVDGGSVGHLSYGYNGDKWWVGGYDSTAAGEPIPNATPTLTQTLNYAHYIYDLMLWRARDTDTDHPEDYVSVVYEAAKLFAGWNAYKNSGYTVSPPWFASSAMQNPTPGTSAHENRLWAAQQLHSNASMQRVMVRAYPYLVGYTGDPTNHAAVMAALREALLLHPYGRFKFVGLTGPLVTAISTGSSWLRSFFPLATEWVAFTDRSFFSVPFTSHELLFQASTGGSVDTAGTFDMTIAPDPVVLDEAGRDLSHVVSLVRGRAWTSSPAQVSSTWTARIANFDTQPKSVVVRLWPGFQAGSYDAFVGVQDPANPDAIPSTPVLGSNPVVLAPGDEIPINLAARLSACDPRITLLHFNLLSATPTPPHPSIDVAVSRATSGAEVSSGGPGPGPQLKFTRTIHNLGVSSTSNATFSVDVYVDRPGLGYELTNLGASVSGLQLDAEGSGGEFNASSKNMSGIIRVIPDSIAPPGVVTKLLVIHRVSDPAETSFKQNNVIRRILLVDRT